MAAWDPTHWLIPTQVTFEKGGDTDLITKSKALTSIEHDDTFSGDEPESEEDVQMIEAPKPSHEAASESAPNDRYQNQPSLNHGCTTKQSPQEGAAEHTRPLPFRMTIC